MIGEVAGLVGGSSSPSARTKAITALDRAADWLNMAGVFLWRHKEKEYTSSDLSAGDTTLDLPADWGWPIDPAYAYNTDGNIIKRIEWKTWDVFQTLDPQVGSGIPGYISLKNEPEDLAYLWPAIDTDDVDSIKVNYFARVQRPSEEDGDIVLMPESREALICGGEAFIMRHRYAKYPRIWEPFWDLFERATRGAVAASNRWLDAVHMAAVPDVNGILTTKHYGNLGQAGRLSVGPAYIQIG